MGRRASAFVLLLGCGIAAPAFAVPPVVVYAPAPDQYLSMGENCGSAASESAGAELLFGAGGNCTIGATCNVSATPGGGSGTGITNTTIIGCSISTLSGNGTVGLQLPPGGISFEGSTSTPANIGVTCTPGGQNTIARLCCTESRGGTTFNPVFDVSCPSPTNPEFNSTPAEGATLPLTTTVGSSTNTTVTVTNSGTGPLNVTPTGLSGVLSVTPTGMQAIAAGGSQMFTVTCSPTSASTVQQSLTLTTNDADEGMVQFTAQCTGTVPPAPEISVSPTPPGPLGIATTQPANGQTTFTVSNTGNASLSVTSISGLDAPFSVLPTNAMIAGGGNQVFTVTCSGASIGGFSDQLTINSNDADEMAVVLNVNCNVSEAPAPEFQSSPPSPGPLTIAYTLPTAFGQTSVTVQNVGTQTLQISSAAGLSGFLSVSPPSANLGPGANQVFTISCSRNMQGADNQVLTFATNDADEGNVGYNVACNVQSAAAPEFQSVPSPAQPFSISTSQGVPAQAMLAVQNVGSSALNITGITQPASNATVTPNGPFPIVIGAGGSTNFTVTCTAGTSGTFPLTFTLMTNDADEAAVQYTLTCTVGVPASAEFDSSPASNPAPGNIEFALETTVGANVSDTLLVSNTGTAPLSLSFTGLDAPFSVAPPGGNVAPGTQQSFVITCNAAAAGTFNDSFTVTTNDPDDGEASVPFDVSCFVDTLPPVYASDPPVDDTIQLLVPVGGSSARAITITNANPAGGDALELNILPVDPPLTVVPTGPVSIPSGGNINLRVACSPTAEIELTQTLEIDTNAPNVDPAKYTLSCVGVPPAGFSSTPSPFSAFAFSTQIGLPVRDGIRVENVGGADLFVIASGLAGNLSVDPPNAVIPSGTSVEFTVTCSAESASDSRRTLTFATNDPTQPTVEFYVFCVVPVRLEAQRAIQVLYSSDTFRVDLFRDGFE